MSKRTLDAFFKPPPKRTKQSSEEQDVIVQPPDTHETYPHPISKLPIDIEKALQNGDSTPARQPKIMNKQPDLDCLYFQPFIPRATANSLFRFLRAELPFYRVVYFAKRGGTDVEIRTPRFTTVFGVDEGCFFEDSSDNASSIESALPDADLDADDTPGSKAYNTSTLTLRKKISNTASTSTAGTATATVLPKYGHNPRPIPSSLQTLKKIVEKATSTTYNFVLVNYYASGEDSIAFHSDDERFLGFEPSIASLSLGAEREFLLKHKPVPSPGATAAAAKTNATGSGSSSVGASASSSGPAPSGETIKLPLGSGDMILMKGSTQSNWLHSIPKRKGKAGVGGRINITFRKAVIPAGTDNYYHYNVGTGGVWRWDDVKMEMVERKEEKGTQNEAETAGLG